MPSIITVTVPSPPSTSSGGASLIQFPWPMAHGLPYPKVYLNDFIIIVIIRILWTIPKIDVGLHECVHPRIHLPRPPRMTTGFGPQSSPIFWSISAYIVFFNRKERHTSSLLLVETPDPPSMNLPFPRWRIRPHDDDYDYDYDDDYMNMQHSEIKWFK